MKIGTALAMVGAYRYFSVLRPDKPLVRDLGAAVKLAENVLKWHAPAVARCADPSPMSKPEARKRLKYATAITAYALNSPGAPATELAVLNALAIRGSRATDFGDSFVVQPWPKTDPAYRFVVVTK